MLCVTMPHLQMPVKHGFPVSSASASKLGPALRPPPSTSFASERERASTPEFLRIQKTLAHVPRDDEERSGSEEDTDESVVKIVSTDPRAAARAAAILKMNDYEWLPKPVKSRRSSAHSSFNRSLSHSEPSDYLRSVRRKSLVSSGVKKSGQKMGVLGDRVYIPGSPVVSVGELMKEAEGEVSILHERSMRSEKSGRSETSVRSEHLLDSERGERKSVFPAQARKDGWMKEDWKLLDACFTDERLATGADADEVAAENVVARFLELSGWQVGDHDRVQLLGRVDVLRRKQREGRGAPGTPALFSTMKHKSTPFVPASAPRSLPSSQWSMGGDGDAPDFTPLPRKITATAGGSLARPRLAAAVFGRRYTSLVDEARRSEDVPDNQYDSDKSAADASVESIAEVSVEEDASVTSTSVSPPPASKLAPRQSLGGRVKGLLFSYLPTLSRKPVPPKERRPAALGVALPLPPPEVLNRPRTVHTPGPKPVERAVAPTVPLRDVGVKETTSRIPVRRREEPRRLVELRHVVEEADTSVSSTSSGRRSSAGSVKELRMFFEEQEKMAREAEVRANRKRKERR
ncbi:hypothetical protein OE88DRAFT_767522 [Heliocybe sulcata]|uniref:Uncharacterized protein n=1 Tax=Heliocybe sulcata TaxID=5364 RepID=A0A5C3MRX6_9AGAM|nr:hypothetical protein OE88DRAFT_767522 [Heliocybe sulcata]